MISAFISLEIPEVPLDKEKEGERRGSKKQDKLLRAGSAVAVYLLEVYLSHFQLSI